MLEKPLKMVQLSAMVQCLFAHQQLLVTIQCDYFTFRDIAAALSNEHGCIADNLNSSRVAFYTSFHTNQSESTTADDMSIIFSCLDDITTFLHIRDDNDYE